MSTYASILAGTPAMTSLLKKENELGTMKDIIGTFGLCICVWASPNQQELRVVVSCSVPVVSRADTQCGPKKG